MNIQQIVGLFVRIFSLWLVVCAIQAFSLGITLSGNKYYENILIYYFLSVVLVFFAVALWFFPMTIAHRILPRAKFNDPLNVGALDISFIVCFIFGGWLFFAHAFPNIMQFVDIFIPAQEGIRRASYMNIKYFVMFIKVVFYLASSLFFIIKRDVVSKYILMK